MDTEEVLVIGYGNALRGDDGAGIAVVTEVERRRWPGVRTLAVQQLTPELVDPLAAAGRAIFVDASPAENEVEVQVVALEAVSELPSLGHTGDPRVVLALTLALHGHCPPAWWVLVPGTHFEVGEGLSPGAASAVEQALLAVERLCRAVAPTHSDPGA